MNSTKLEQIRLVAKFEGIELPDSEDMKILMDFVSDHFHELMRKQCLADMEYLIYGPAGRQPFTGIYPCIKPFQAHPGAFFLVGAVS